MRTAGLRELTGSNLLSCVCRAVDEAVAAKRATAAEEGAHAKERVLAVLEAGNSDSDESGGPYGADSGSDLDDDGFLSGGRNRGASACMLEAARVERARATADRREAIARAVDREDRKAADAEARKVLREARTLKRAEGGGSVPGSAPGQGKGGGTKGGSRAAASKGEGGAPVRAAGGRDGSSKPGQATRDSRAAGRDRA